MENLLHSFRVMLQRQSVGSDWRNTARKRAEGDRADWLVGEKAVNNRQE